MSRTDKPNVANDDRFASMHSSSLFKKTAAQKKKVKIDSRFEGVLTDDRFRVDPGQVDKYGRKKKRGVKQAEQELSEFYEVEKEQDEVVDEVAASDNSQDQSNSDPESEGGNDVEQPATSKHSSLKGMGIEDRLEFLNRFARGEIEESSSSSEEDDESDSRSNSGSDDDISDEEVSESEEDGALSLYQGPLVVPEDTEIEVGESTYRLGLQNCDWEHLRAEDLHIILQSFCPAGGIIESVTVYLSDFGKERIEAETKYGPQWIWKESNNDASNPDRQGKRSKLESDDGDFVRPAGQVGVVFQTEVDTEEQDVLLRKYELSKLRYYFAIAVCSSIQVAESLYNQLDGVEMESSSMVFDLRFVPDDISFEGRTIRDHSTSRTLALDSYEAPDFVVNALQHTKVECSWDTEKDKERKLTNISMWRKLKEDDLMQYVASSDSSDVDSSDEGQSKAKRSQKASSMRNLLLGGMGERDSDDEDRSGQEDDFFLAGDENNDAEVENSENGEMSLTFIPSEDKHNTKVETKAETPFEKILAKMSEKKKQRKLARKEKKLIDDITEPIERKSPPQDSKSSDLDLLFAGEEQDANDYDMRALKKASADSKKKRSKKGTKVDEKEHDSFEVDLRDDRFSGLLNKDGRFGIDPTSQEFKSRDTKEMQRILDAQRTARHDETKFPVEPKPEFEAPATNTANLLAAKLKRKFGSK